MSKEIETKKPKLDKDDKNKIWKAYGFDSVKVSSRRKGRVSKILDKKADYEEGLYIELVGPGGPLSSHHVKSIEEGRKYLVEEIIPFVDAGDTIKIS